MDAARDAPVPPGVRRVILRTFTRKHHLQLRADAVQFVYGTLRAHDLLGDEGVMTEAVEALATALVEQHVSGAQGAHVDGLVVTAEILRRTYDRLVVESADDAGGGGGGGGAAAPVTHGDAPGLERYFAVVDAFSMPRLVFSGARKVFEAYVCG